MSKVCPVLYQRGEHKKEVGLKIPREILHTYMEIKIPKIWAVLILENTRFFLKHRKLR